MTRARADQVLEAVGTVYEFLTDEAELEVGEVFSVLQAELGELEASIQRTQEEDAPPPEEGFLEYD